MDTGALWFHSSSHSYPHPAPASLSQLLTHTCCYSELRNSDPFIFFYLPYPQGVSSLTPRSFFFSKNVVYIFWHCLILIVQSVKHMCIFPLLLLSIYLSHDAVWLLWSSVYLFIVVSGFASSHRPLSFITAIQLNCCRLDSNLWAIYTFNAILYVLL